MYRTPAHPHMLPPACAAKLEREGLRGYQYEGQTQFVASRGKQGLPTLKLEQVLGQQRPAGAEYRTVLVHRDGSRFTKRWAGLHGGTCVLHTCADDAWS